MKNMLRKTALPFALSLALLAGGALAQSTAPASSASTAAPSTSKTHAERKMDRVEEQIDELHSQLQITDAQSKEWNAYTQVMRDNARKAASAFHDRAQKLPGMNADEVMKSYAQLAQMHADDMQHLASAWSDLYATFSPEQKQTADAVFQRKATTPHHGGAHKKSAKPASAASSGT